MPVNDRPSCAKRRETLLRALAIVASPALGSAASAQTPRNTPIRIIVPYAAGGATDLFARLIAARLSEVRGRPVVVENKPGANGIIGAAQAASAAPDGNTLLFTVTSVIQNPSLKAKVPYDLFRDLVPVSEVGEAPLGLAVPASLPVANLAEFIELVRAAPGHHNFGSFGVGSTGHIYGILLMEGSGIDMVHVAYRGDAQSIVALLSGELTAAFVALGGVQPYVAAKQVRVLGVNGSKRSAQMPEAPTFAEQGYPALEIHGWMGMFAPGGTPDDVVQSIAADVNALVRSPEIVARARELGVDAYGSDPKDFAAVVKTDYWKWREVIERHKLALD